VEAARAWTGIRTGKRASVCQAAALTAARNATGGSCVRYLA